MGTRPTASKIETIQDLKSLMQKVTPAVLKAWAAEDKKKKKTGGVNAAFVTKLRADLRSLDGAKTLDTKQATAKERAARAALREPLVSLRNDVAETFPDDKDLQREFGVGKKLSNDSTPLLLDAADGVAKAFETYGAQVAAAGVSKQRVAEIQKLRAALADADSSQRDQFGARKGATATNDALFASVRKRSALVRKRLERSAPQGTVRSTARRHTVKKRAAKAAPGGSVPS